MVMKDQELRLPESEADMNCTEQQIDPSAWWKQAALRMISIRDQYALLTCEMKAKKNVGEGQIYEKEKGPRTVMARL